jgi:hypothetical protein
MFWLIDAAFTTTDRALGPGRMQARPCRFADRSPPLTLDKLKRAGSLAGRCVGLFVFAFPN